MPLIRRHGDFVLGIHEQRKYRRITKGRERVGAPQCAPSGPVPGASSGLKFHKAMPELNI